MNAIIKHGDCLLSVLPQCKLLLTDIPYGEVNRPSSGLRCLDKSKADVTTFDLHEFLDHIYPSFDICVIFCGKEQFSFIYSYFALMQENKQGTVRHLIWSKSNPSPMNGEYVYLSSVENMVWFKKKGTGKLNCFCKKSVFTFPSGSSKYHPTEKNHALLKDLILDNTNVGDLVLDTCMGSGSAGIVALENGRSFYGIELDDYYYPVAKRRIKEVPDSVVTEVY